MQLSLKRSTKTKDTKYYRFLIHYNAMQSYMRTRNSFFFFSLVCNYQANRFFNFFKVLFLLGFWIGQLPIGLG